MIETKKHESISKPTLTSPCAEFQKFLELRLKIANIYGFVMKA